MKSLTRILPALTLALALTGCVEIYDEYTLNPDGSGKVERRTIAGGMALEGFGTPDDAASQARQTVREMLKESTGVDTWKDVRYEVRADGKAEVFATAYFSDLNALELAGGGMGGPGGTPQLERNPDGSATLTLGEEDEGAGEVAEPPDLNEAELRAEVERARNEFQASKPFMQAMLGGMVIDTAFRLPGPPTESNNFRQDGDLLRVTMKGEDMMNAVETLMQDTDWMLEQARLGKDDFIAKPGDSDRLNEIIFGSPGPVQAVIPPGAAPLFDYAAEVAEAQERFSDMLAELGMEAPVPAAPAEGGGFAELLVAGVQWVRYDDPDEGIRPFNEQAGYKLCIVGRFDGSVLSVDEGVVTEAVADTGQDLLPEREWDRSISWPRLSESKTAVVFEVPLLAPAANVRGLARVAGTLQYRVATSTEDVDIGVEHFAEGATGRRYGALVEQVGPRAWGDGTSLTLRVELPADQIQEALFYAQDGSPIQVERGSTMQMGETSSLEYVTEGEFPPVGRIVLRVFSDMQVYEAPFVLEDLDLMGQVR